MTLPMAKNKTKSAVRTAKPKELPSLTIRPSILRDPYEGLIPDAATIAKANAELDAIRTGAVTGPVTGPVTDPATTPLTDPVTEPVTTPATHATTHAITHAETAAETKVETAVETYAEAAAITAVETYAEAAAITAVETYAEAAAITQAVETAATRAKPKRQETTAEGPTTLDATHTPNERSVYSVMYRETISKGVSVRNFSVPELMQMTGIRSDNTVRRCLLGLRDKLSIERLSEVNGGPAGTPYRVFHPRDVVIARDKQGMVIELRSKQILKGKRSERLTRAETAATHAATDATTAVKTTAAIHSRTAGDNPANIEAHDKYNINPNGPAQSSSVPNNSDDGKLTKVQKLFEQLSSGGKWKDDRDLQAYAQIAHVGIFHIILGLCYSVTKSPEHRMSSLAYAVQSILKHAEDMDEFSQSTMEEIAYRAKRKTMNCIAEGKWTVPEWET